jgi:hypothetical protein
MGQRVEVTVQMLGDYIATIRVCDIVVVECAKHPGSSDARNHAGMTWYTRI